MPISSLYSAGAPVQPQRLHAPQTASRSGSRCTCWAFAAGPHSPQQRRQPQAAVAGGPDRAAALQPSAQDKYDRILAFVDTHATPVVLSNSSAFSSSSSSVAEQVEQQQQQQVTSSWHHSYDEEADEGEELHEPAVLAYAAAVPVAVAAAAAPTEAAGSSYGSASSWSYGNHSNPKPFFYAWDEEAEGAFELEAAPVAAAVPADPVAAAAALRTQRAAALHEARHAARISRRMRRSQLHPQLGDLEHMQAWVQPATQQQQQHSSRRSPAGVRYQQLLALVAGDAAAGQYRQPKHWHLTFDEECHGPDAPETVLGSC